jgi:hypothetical protein
MTLESGAPDFCIGCEVYIGVMGFSATEYSILVALHSDVPQTLVDGQPQVGYVNATVTDQYVMRLNGVPFSVDLTLTTVFGDADMFVTLDDSKPTKVLPFFTELVLTAWTYFLLKSFFVYGCFSLNSFLLYKHFSLKPFLMH